MHKTAESLSFGPCNSYPLIKFGENTLKRHFLNYAPYANFSHLQYILVIIYSKNFIWNFMKKTIFIETFSTKFIVTWFLNV